MDVEEEDIMRRISALAGQINRHKNSRAVAQAQARSGSPYARPSHHIFAARGSYGSRGRGYMQGGRHRNRTLILNRGTAQDENIIALPNGTDVTPTGSPNAFVSKRDRHLQLINTAVYDKQSEQRAKAIEETRKRRLLIRDEKERVRIARFLKSSTAASTTSSDTTKPSTHELMIDGIRFAVTKRGSRLSRLPGKSYVFVRGARTYVLVDQINAGATPKRVDVGGVTFYRSKNGNLYRSAVVKAQRRTGIIKQINEPCGSFSQTGSCINGNTCRYIHDPDKVAACRDFIQKGSCAAGDSCDLSHDLKPERSPLCLHFERHNCSKPDCRYSHMEVSVIAPVCRRFGLYGYCERGSACTDRHVNECPDFSNTGVCKRSHCRLPHREKASVMRKKAAQGNPDQDISSDDDESDPVDGDDVDSDEMELFGLDDGPPDSDIPLQRDYVGF